MSKIILDEELIIHEECYKDYDIVIYEHDDQFFLVIKNYEDYEYPDDDNVYASKDDALDEAHDMIDIEVQDEDLDDEKDETEEEEEDEVEQDLDDFSYLDDYEPDDEEEEEDF